VVVLVGLVAVDQIQQVVLLVLVLLPQLLVLLYLEQGVVVVNQEELEVLEAPLADQMELQTLELEVVDLTLVMLVVLVLLLFATLSKEIINVTLRKSTKRISH
jgi:hypothetical protein